jgi:hypothetical protein
MQKILEGELSSFEVPDLLVFLEAGRRTGVLVLEGADCETKLFLRAGRPVFAVSTAEELRFGSLLVRHGKITAEGLERLRKRQRAGTRLGSMLLAEKVVGEEALASLLKVQVSEIFFDAIGWREGVFTFLDRVPPPATAITLDMDLRNLILEGVRRVDVRERLGEVFPDRGLAVEAVVNPDRAKESLNLTEDEWRVFFLVDGRRRVEEICGLAGPADERATLAILHRLRAARLVELVPAPAPPPPVAAPAPAVEFAAPRGARSRPEDDTREIVDRQAIPYLADAPAVTVARLALQIDGAESSFPLVKDTYTLGRHGNNDIVISDPKASAFHARIDRTPEGFMLVDLRSRNGSWVNGQRVEAAMLKTGDELRLGAARLVYKVDCPTTAPLR